MSKDYVWEEEIKRNHGYGYTPPKEGYCSWCGAKEDDYFWLN